MSNWKNDLRDAIAKNEASREESRRRTEDERQRVLKFVSETLIPALEEIKMELEKQGMTVKVSNWDDRANISVYKGVTRKLEVTIDGKLLGTEELYDSRGGTVVAHSGLTKSGNSMSPLTATKEDIIEAFVSQFKSRL